MSLIYNYRASFSTVLCEGTLRLCSLSPDAIAKRGSKLFSAVFSGFLADSSEVHIASSQYFLNILLEIK